MTANIISFLAICIDILAITISRRNMKRMTQGISVDGVHRYAQAMVYGVPRSKNVCQSHIRNE